VFRLAADDATLLENRRMIWLLRAIVLAAVLGGFSAAAQEPQKPASQWAKMPRMQLERQFAGPLEDTIVQRWRDPDDGTVCYIYLPITAVHSPPTASGFVQYGANYIGSISCFAVTPSRHPAKPGG
jgi:hypothetical protein